MNGNPGNPTSKLQVLIEEGCVDANAVANLTAEARGAIEKLSWTEVDNLISAYKKTGQQTGLFWI
jgi:hypothetical protein